MHGHQGLRFEITIGLNDNRERWYSPSLQRFVSVDPIGFVGGYTNLYVYEGNGPVGAVDPLGLQQLGSYVDPTPSRASLIAGTFTTSPSPRSSFDPTPSRASLIAGRFGPPPEPVTSYEPWFSFYRFDQSDYLKYLAELNDKCKGPGMTARKPNTPQQQLAYYEKLRDELNLLDRDVQFFGRFVREDIRERYDSIAEILREGGQYAHHAHEPHNPAEERPRGRESTVSEGDEAFIEEYHRIIRGIENPSLRYWIGSGPGPRGGSRATGRTRAYSSPPIGGRSSCFSDRIRASDIRDYNRTVRTRP